MVGITDGGTVVFNVVSGERCDVLSFVTADKEHIERCSREGGEIRQVEVSCATLNRLFAKHAIEAGGCPFDRYRGRRLDALRGLDFDKIRPRLILLEVNHDLAQQDLLRLMGPLHYRVLQKFRPNILFEGGLDSRENYNGGFPCELLL